MTCASTGIVRLSWAGSSDPAIKIGPCPSTRSSATAGSWRCCRARSPATRCRRRCCWPAGRRRQERVAAGAGRRRSTAPRRGPATGSSATPAARARRAAGSRAASTRTSSCSRRATAGRSRSSRCAPSSIRPATGRSKRAVAWSSSTRPTRWSHEAQSALLKTLEEPPSASIFLLVSSLPDALLPTVRSRCPRLRFGPLAPGEVAGAARARPRLQRRRAHARRRPTPTAASAARCRPKSADLVRCARDARTRVLQQAARAPIRCARRHGAGARARRRARR